MRPMFSKECSQALESVCDLEKSDDLGTSFWPHFGAREAELTAPKAKLRQPNSQLVSSKEDAILRGDIQASPRVRQSDGPAAYTRVSKQAARQPGQPSAVICRLCYVYDLRPALGSGT